MSVIEKLISGDDADFRSGLLEFSETYEKHTTFEELNRENLKKDVWDSIFSRLEKSEYLTVPDHSLKVLRMLSRDKAGLDELITVERLHLILKYAGLANAETQQDFSPRTDTKKESLKLLSNLLFNSAKVQQIIGETPCLSNIIKRLTPDSKRVQRNIKLLDMRILFLATALNPSLRNVFENELNGDACLIETLSELGNRLDCKDSCIEEMDITLACEILKVLFNLYISTDSSNGKKLARDKRLVGICYKILVNRGCHKFGNKIDLQSNVINILTVIPYNCYEPLIPPIGDIGPAISYEGTDMTAVSRMLEFLNQRLDGNKDLAQDVSPVITALIRLVQSQRLIRKFVRSQILPPLKDVMKRPEEGSTLRAKLCKLLTSPIAAVSDLVAELIFILCKENVNRMVKYTGYGNAAGMFANKGLLGGRDPMKDQPAYSSESEDSDTEEYTKYKESINPVTGCYEPPKPNPLEGMSEEQKEYEAMKLVNLVDQLTKQGVVHPCRVGEDGKPKPIEHILELQEELPKLNMNNRAND